MGVTERLLSQIAELEAENKKHKEAVDFLSEKLAAISDQGFHISKIFWKDFAYTRDHYKSVKFAKEQVKERWQKD